jgi:hypothetical protein
VTRAGWAGVKNGALLKLAEESFDVFVSADLNIPHQQNLRGSPLGFVFLRAGGTQLRDILPYIDDLREAISMVDPGQLAYVPGDPPAS